MIQTNIILESYALLVTIVLLLCSSFDNSRDDRSGRLMKAMLWCNAAFLLSTIGNLYCEGKPWLEVPDYIVTFIECSVGFPMALIYSEYVVDAISQKGKVTPDFLMAMKIVCVAAVAVNFVSIFNNICFSCEGAVYARGPVFWLSQLSAAIMLFSNAVLVVIKRKALGNEVMWIFLIYVLMPAIATAGQLPIPAFNTMCLATTLSIFIIYITVYIHRSRVLAEQEKELTESRIAVMLSQIQPHFLYNALSVIQDMCHGKSPEAEEATVEFSEFLRSNLDSLNLSVPVSFEQELKHTKNYLSLESKRFGDRLNIRYEIGTTGFRMPALTLQPIVENAVRYGILQKEGTGTVVISRVEKEDGFEVRVIDDGLGFDVNMTKDDGRTHIGIENVRERLRVMSDGELKISSIPGEGTVAVIRIPKE